MNHSIRKMVRHASRASRLLDALVVGGDLGTEASQAVISYLSFTNPPQPGINNFWRVRYLP